MHIRKDVNSREWTRRQIAEYKKRYQNYKLYAEVLEQVLKQVAKNLAPAAIVQTRPKSIISVAEKCQRKKVKYLDPVNQFTDLCGGRVIVHTAEEVKAISGFIETHFLIDEENTTDVSQRLKPTEFGYRSVHYIISFKQGIFPNRLVNVTIPPLLLDDQKFPNRRAEIQVRTILEHAWADLSHDLAYKNSFKIPVMWEREFAAVAALLEGADKTFSRIKQALNTYATSYGAYMNEEQMKDEIKLLENILEFDPGNAEVACCIGKLAITLGEWQKAIDLLSEYVHTGNPSVLRDLGVALCKKHKYNPGSRKFKQGQGYLEKVCTLPNRDVDAIASLAGTWKGINEEKVRNLYRLAYQTDPSDPYPLENFLDIEIASARDTSIIPLLSPVITAAITRCRNQADVGVNLPWVFYMMGKFYLLLNKPYDSLEAYAKAVQLCPTSWMIESAHISLERLSNVSKDLSGYEWVRRFLLIAKALISKNKIKETPKEPDKPKAATETLENSKELAISPDQPIEGPVVILVGGCDHSVEQQIRSYRQLVLEGFRDFKGTVISGGTIQGISGLAGELGKVYNSIRTIGYIPGLIPASANVDQRYSELRKTNGSGFSPLEALQTWTDIIVSGLDPCRIKILGINGGKISAIEYRIALALGATVGVIAESGGEVAKLLRDEKWIISKKLIILPADAMTVRAFIGSGGQRIEADIRETLAREIHEEYRKTRQDGLKTDDCSLVDWDKLPDGFKESNAQQADHIFEKLSQIGYTMGKVKNRKIKIAILTKAEVELLAEIEHGRWNTERLLEGWTWGEEKDILRKKSPYLVKWSQLSDEVKEWDRATVRKIPEFLARIGLEIQRSKVSVYKYGAELSDYTDRGSVNVAIKNTAIEKW